jgi:hypothetical protein
MDDTIHATVSRALRTSPPSILVDALRVAFDAHVEALGDIEVAFQRFTSTPSPLEATRAFVHSWSLTNHSAMCVSGISNRMTIQLRAREGLADPARLVDALLSLHRISDEDLGVGGGVVHADLFYEMAELLCGGDEWLSRRHAIPAAVAFRNYKHHAGLRHPDLVQALLTTVVHEVYTHGEVEFILPLFRAMVDRSPLEERQKRRRLAWISVHCGATERDHFHHAVDATWHYAAARGVRLEDYDLASIFGEYLEKKAAVMRGLLALMAAGDTEAAILGAA